MIIARSRVTVTHTGKGWCKVGCQLHRGVSEAPGRSITVRNHTEKHDLSLALTDAVQLTSGLMVHGLRLVFTHDPLLTMNFAGYIKQRA